MTLLRDRTLGGASPAHGADDAEPAEIRRMIERQLSLVDLNDVIDDGQTQAMSLGVFVDSRAAAGDARQVLILDAGAVVFDRDGESTGCRLEPQTNP